MKKLFISIMAAAALVSCSKADIAYENPSEISFAPFAKKTTKAAVVDTKYPKNLNMYVFANAGTGTTISEYAEPYFKNALFKDIDENGIFAGYPAYYWPNVKSLIFSGVSASGNVNGTGKFEYNTTDKEWQITLTGYEPGKGTSKAGDNDLMWFSPDKPYSKADVPGTGTTAALDNDIEVTMKHACAWITIKIKGDDITSGTSGTTPWKINSLKLDKLATKGNAVLGSAATWNTLTETEPTEGADYPAALTIHNNADGTNLTANYVDYTKKTVVSRTTFEDFITIPQATRKLYITYSFVSQEGATDDDDIVITETKEISLAFNGDENWGAGVHYTYNITIGAKEILIEPSVENWTTYENVDVTI